jgi:heme-degrading monooxygenase HmoA
MSFITIWHYKIKPGSEKEFINLYNNAGEWVKLFSKFAGYIKTVLIKSTGDDNIFITLDYWESKEDYYLFKKNSIKEFSEIDKMGEKLTIEEKHIGEFIIPE